MIQIIAKIEIEKSHSTHHLLFLQPVAAILYVLNGTVVMFFRNLLKTSCLG